MELLELAGPIFLRKLVSGIISRMNLQNLQNSVQMSVNCNYESIYKFIYNVISEAMSFREANIQRNKDLPVSCSHGRPWTQSRFSNWTIFPAQSATGPTRRSATHLEKGKAHWQRKRTYPYGIYITRLSLAPLSSYLIPQDWTKTPAVHPRAQTIEKDYAVPMTVRQRILQGQWIIQCSLASV